MCAPAATGTFRQAGPDQGRHRVKDGWTADPDGEFRQVVPAAGWIGDAAPVLNPIRKPHDVAACRADVKPAQYRMRLVHARARQQDAHYGETGATSHANNPGQPEG
jgi:hypothetical protein